jgi:predicted MFS family arabinose efflux permease
VLVSADLLGTSWRPAFLINVPLGAALLVAAVRWLPCDRQGPRRPLDLGGVAMLSGATLLAVLPLVLGREAGWPAWTWASLAASVPALAAFIAWERGVIRRGGYPLMNLHVLRSPAVSWGLTAHGAGTMTYFSLLFVLAVYLQDGLGKSPLFSGLALVLWVAAFGIAGPLLPRLPERLAPLVPVAGCLILAAAYVALSAGVLADVAGGPLLVVLLGLGGFGLGTSFSGLIGHLTSAVPTGNAPDISGLLVMVAQMSGVVGVATFGTAYFALASDPARAFAIVAGVFALTSLAAALAAHRSTQPAEERRLARGALTRPSP